MSNQITVGDLMAKGIYTVNLEDTVKHADKILRDENIRHIPVIDDGKFIGMITDRSLMEYTLRRLYDFDDNYDEIGQNQIGEFQEIMSKNIHVIFPEDSIKKATKIMAKYKIDCIPVVDWKNNLVGLLTATDLLLYFHNKLLD